MGQKIFTVTDWIHQILSVYIKEGDLVIDATAGKGKDTLFLSKMAGETGKVLAFDVQKEAIDISQALIKEEGFEKRVEFILDGHENMDCYAKEESAKVVLFNLGYLPGGDHSLATRKETTLEAIEKALKIVRSEGVVCVCIYSGGDTGYEEKEAVLEFVKGLPAREYDVIACPLINKKNDPPMPVFIRKR